MDAFYLISTELRNAFKPRLCEVKARLSNGSRDDIALVEVKPPLAKKLYNTPQDITQVLVISREEGTSPFSLSGAPVYVYICLPLKPQYSPSDVLRESDYTVLDWGSVYRTKEEAADFSRVLSSYRQGMSCDEEQKHKKVMTLAAVAVLAAAAVIGFSVLYVLNLVDRQFENLQKNILYARQDVRHIVEEAIDSSQETEATALLTQLKDLNSQLEILGKEIEQVKQQLETSAAEPVPLIPEEGDAPADEAIPPEDSIPQEETPSISAEEPASVQEEIPLPETVESETVVPEEEITVIEEEPEIIAEVPPQAQKNATIADAIAAVTRQVVTDP